MDISRIRRFVIDLLPEVGVAPSQPNWEMLLVSDGKPMGCRFEFDQVRAFWFAARRSVEFYGADWAPLKEAGIDTGRPS